MGPRWERHVRGAGRGVQRDRHRPARHHSVERLAVWPGRHHDLMSSDDSAAAWPGREPVEDVRQLRAALTQAVAERDEARGWARAEYHQMWDAPYLPDNAPDWLTAPM